MALRRRGKVLPFVPKGRETVRIPEALLRRRLDGLEVALRQLLVGRLAGIDGEKDEDLRLVLAEMQVQAIVLGGYGLHVRTCLPPQYHEFVDANMVGFADWLERRRGT